MQSGTSSGRVPGRDVVKGKTKSTKASTGDLEAGKSHKIGVHQINQQSMIIGSPVDPWMLAIKDWKPGIFLKRIWISSCPVLVSRVARLDASFMILPSLPMGTPSPPRVVGLKIATENMAFHIFRSPGRWYFSAAPRSGGLHHHWGLQRPAFVMMDDICFECWKYRSHFQIQPAYLQLLLGVSSWCIFKGTAAICQTKWYFQSSDHTFHQVFSSLANMASWNATEISRNDIVTSRNGFMAMNIRHVESML